MDPRQNPYAPGAGTQPPELAGRDSLVSEARLATERVKGGRANQGLVLIGLRGVGKTVLLDHMRVVADADGICAIRMEASARRSLPSMLVPELHLALTRLSRNAAARSLAQHAIRVVAGFVRSMHVKFGDIEFGITAEPAPDTTASGDLEHALTVVLGAVAAAAAKAGTALAMYIDELQYVPRDQLAALIVSLHRCAQDQAPVILIAAGLPQLRAKIGDAVTYAERMFNVFELGALSPEAARAAIEKPLTERGVAISRSAVEKILTDTQCYPYFLQEWGKRVWNIAPTSPIKVSDVEAATTEAIAALDASFFSVRFDRLTYGEKRYLRAMAELGPGPHASGDIAAAAGRDVRALSKLRNHLISKGMVWGPTYGNTAFTVPLFDQFMRRTLPRIER